MTNLFSQTEEWRDEMTNVEHVFEADYYRMCSQMALEVSKAKGCCSFVKAVVVASSPGARFNPVEVSFHFVHPPLVTAGTVLTVAFVFQFVCF